MGKKVFVVGVGMTKFEKPGRREWDYPEMATVIVGNGYFKAYDAETGSILWKFQAGAGVNAPPATYTVEGQQYIVVAAGGNTQLNFKRGNNILAFTLVD